ncbi:MAG TPA: hypothetical protein VFU16_05715 [Solirubrobacterales bacterium]|nr:hypothetical protein [Solirubrobacterales bacterium]
MAEFEELIAAHTAQRKPASRQSLRKQRPVQRQAVKARVPVEAIPPAQEKAPTHQMGEVIALRLTRSSRGTAVSFLQSTGLSLELEHLLALEERLSVGSTPALFHAALSTRFVLGGIADLCFSPRDEPFIDRFGGKHQVAEANVKNRIAAFVDTRLRHELSNEEHRLFVATLDTVSRWCGRGPHRIYSPVEAQRFFIRLLDVLSVVSRAFYAPRN